MIIRTILHAGFACVIGALLLLAVSTPMTAAATNGIVRPSQGAILTGNVGVNGVADDPAFAAWQLDLLPRGSADTTIFVARGTNRVEVSGPIARLDTPLYPNGNYMLRLRVIKQDGNYTEYLAAVTINNSGLRNGITLPLAGAKLACLATVRGIAEAADFRKWQVDLLVGGDEQAVVPLDHGSTPHAGEGPFAQFDTTQIPDGEHLLRLRVVRNDGNYQEIFTRVAVDNSVMQSVVNRNSCNCARPDPEAQPVDSDGISNPPDRATVHGVVPICGIAANPSFAAWQMDLLFDADENHSVPVAQGDTANPTRAPFTLLDTTALPDGQYGLRLRVGLADNTIEKYTITFCVSNQQKEISAKSNRCGSSASSMLSFP